MPTNFPRRVLVVMPRFPFPEAGACEQDRAEGLRQLRRLGCEVEVVAKYFDWQDPVRIEAQWKQEGVYVTLVKYKFKKNATSVTGWLRKIAFIVSHPWYLDGSVLDYCEPEMQTAVAQAFDSFKPDLVWFDYTYLWPLYHLARERHIPIIVRSINFEAHHYLEEEGKTVWHYIKSIPKFFTEDITAREAGGVFAITPFEEKKYQSCGARTTATLPLRSLSHCIGTHTPRETSTLHCFFMGSTYTVQHNYRAAEFIVRELAPRMFQTTGMEFVFHILGAKFPSTLAPFVRNNVIYEGFVDDLETALQTMDIAVAPSFFGAGMQQKIFEPIARGFPTVTNIRGIGGYPFIPGVEVLCADSVSNFEEHLLRLRTVAVRKLLSQAAIQKSRALFSANVLDTTVTAMFTSVCG